MRSSQVCHANERAHEDQIAEHQQPAKRFRSAVFDAELGQHCEKRVEDGGGEDAFDGAIGGCQAFVEAGDFDQARAEEAEGDDGGEELEDTVEALPHAVELGGAEPLHVGHGGGWFDRTSLFVLSGVSEW